LVKHYWQNIFRGVNTAEMIYGDLTSACFQKTDKIFVYSTIDSFFSLKYVARELKRIEKILNLKNIIFWSYNPLFTEFIGKLNEKLFIFDTVDNWSEHPSYTRLLSKNKILQNYKTISEKANVIFTVSNELLDFYKGFGRDKDVYWVPNGVAYDHYNNPDHIKQENQLSTVTKKVIGYLGTIQERIDLDLITKIAEKHSDKIIAMCGPVWPSIRKEVNEKLGKYENIIFTDRVNYQMAPSYMNRFDVAIIPHKLDNFINSTNPMKMYEYLACGKPIVSTAGAGIEMFTDYIYITNKADQFVSYIDRALSEDTPEKQNARRTVAREHSWNSRVDRMVEIIKEKLQ